MKRPSDASEKTLRGQAIGHDESSIRGEIFHWKKEVPFGGGPFESRGEWGFGRENMGSGGVPSIRRHAASVQPSANQVRRKHMQAEAGGDSSHWWGTAVQMREISLRGRPGDTRAEHRCVGGR